MAIRAQTQPGRPTGALFSLLWCTVLSGCAEPEPDAYGNFEAREVVVAAEIAGRLVRFEAREGEQILAGAVVGETDTAELERRLEETLAQQRASVARAAEAAAQVEALEVQLATAQGEYQRTLRLYQAEAATARQLNQSEGEARTLARRVEAARAQAAAIREEGSAAEARIQQTREQIDRGQITNPERGTVLATYVEAGEFVQPGAPLYKVADLDSLTLRAYVSGAQLAGVRLGQTVQVQVDGEAGELRTVEGRVAWISSEAEFTPTPIQTREERTDQVYAVKIVVPNPDGLLKIGMPGEVLLRGEPDDGEQETAAGFSPDRWGG